MPLPSLRFVSRLVGTMALNGIDKVCYQGSINIHSCKSWRDVECFHLFPFHSFHRFIFPHDIKEYNRPKILKDSVIKLHLLLTIIVAN